MYGWKIWEGQLPLLNKAFMRRKRFDRTLFPAYTFMEGDSDSSRRTMDEFHSVLSEMGVDSG
jgi:hypothetical protein